MSFLYHRITGEDAPVINAPPLCLRAPMATDYAQWAQLRAVSRTFLAPWEPTWTNDELTRSAFRRRLRFYAREVREERGYSFFIVLPDNTMVGGISLGHIRRGVAQSAVVGYWLGEQYAGRGYMTLALHALGTFAFDTLNLHRLEAACLPDNTASARVLEKVGFQREGLARQSLRINGEWRDHLLYGLLSTDLCTTPSVRGG
ncbi:MAG: GNAT family protein [Pseudomonadota bacterium]